MNDATTTAAITKLPAPQTPGLAKAAAGAAALSLRKRRDIAGETPSLKLVNEANAAASSAPVEQVPRWRKSRGPRPPPVGDGQER